jgi:hypothetical protein
VETGSEAADSLRAGKITGNLQILGPFGDALRQIHGAIPVRCGKFLARLEQGTSDARTRNSSGGTWNSRSLIIDIIGLRLQSGKVDSTYSGFIPGNAIPNLLKRRLSFEKPIISDYSYSVKLIL